MNYETHHPKLSTLYKPVKLSEIAAYAHNAGFELEGIRKARGLYGAYVAFYKHPSHPDQGGPRLVVLNSNDGTRALRLFMGYFRAVCSNGLILGEGIIPSIRLVHVGKDVKKNMQAFFDQAASNLELVVTFRNKLQNIILTPQKVSEIIIRSLPIREKEKVEGVVTNFYPRREEDLGDNLWTVFNVVQEHLIRGGYKIDGGKTKKPLTSPKEIFRVNTELSELIKEYV
jgi:hypothetical protein